MAASGAFRPTSLLTRSRDRRKSSGAWLGCWGGGQEKPKRSKGRGHCNRRQRNSYLQGCQHPELHGVGRSSRIGLHPRHVENDASSETEVIASALGRSVMARSFQVNSCEWTESPVAPFGQHDLDGPRCGGCVEHYVRIHGSRHQNTKTLRHCQAGRHHRSRIRDH